MDRTIETDSGTIAFLGEEAAMWMSLAVSLDAREKIELCSTPSRIAIIERLGDAGDYVRATAAIAGPYDLQVLDLDGACQIYANGKLEIEYLWPGWVLRDRAIRRTPRIFQWLTRWYWDNVKGEG